MSTFVYTIRGLAIFFLVFWCGIWCLHLIGYFWSHWKLNRKGAKLLDPEKSFPGVSIIKPLVGIDPNLESNLETFFCLVYPRFELLFCVQDKTDPAISLVKGLIAKYPLVDAHIFIGGEKVGINPKINNMQPAYNSAKYELVLISDSGIRMKEDTVMDMVSYMGDDIGLVHQMPFVCDRSGFPAIAEKSGTVPFTKFEYVLAWLFRETTAPFLFVHALFSPNIQWRQGYYRLHWGGLVEEISPKIKL